MKNVFCFFTILNIILFSASAQNMDNWIEKQQVTQFEKLYIHTDREFYFEGDTIWFAAYIVNGQTHLPIDTDCNIYVDIVNKNGEIVQNHIFIAQKGTCSGNVNLNRKKVREGKFLLRAYTDYLKNFGTDSFFKKSIQVSALKNAFENVPDSEPKSTKPAVTFLPEGGFLLAGKSNCVAFKAIDETGKGIPTEGVLLNSSGLEILQFKSMYKGAGKFYFIPQENETYTAKIRDIGQSIKLPPVKSEGAKINVINQNQESVQIMVLATERKENQLYNFAVLHRGKTLFFSQLNSNQLNQIIRIEGSKLGCGINRFVLLDNNYNPVSERLIFHNDLKLSQLEVNIGDESYSSREEVQLNILPGENIENEIAIVSVSVVDENYLGRLGNTENIASYLLLNSELKGNLESPAEYFLNENYLSSQAKLDLLMCVNGWTNYIWNEMPDEKTELIYKHQFGFDFTGRAKRAIGKKGIEEGNVFFMVKSQERTQYLDVPMQQDGHFQFRNVIFYDSASVFAQGRNKRDKHTINFDITFPDASPVLVEKSELASFNYKFDVPVSVYRKRYLNELRLNEYYPNRENILLQEIEVKRKSFMEKWRSGPELKGGGPYLLTPAKTAGTTDIIEYLQTKVVGVFPTRGGQSITMFPGAAAGLEAFDPEPLFWIDYSMTLTVDEVRNYAIDMFETIELRSPPMSYFYRGPNGVILLTTKKGRSLDDRRALLLGGAVKTMNGFTPVREFYIPKYTSQNYKSEIPDYRNTLYWNPKVLISGEKELYFPACDNLSRYKVIVEGLTETGKICLGSADFEVDSKTSIHEN